MTRKEMAEIMSLIKCVFPNYYRGFSREDAFRAMDAWYEMFEDDPAEEVAVAVKRLAAKQIEGFAPTVGAVKYELYCMRHPDRMTAPDAWALVERAISGHVAWDELPETVRRAVGSRKLLREWGYAETEAIHTVVYSNFIKAYTEQERHEREREAVPEKVRRLTEEMASRERLPESTENKEEGRNI